MPIVAIRTSAQVAAARAAALPAPPLRSDIEVRRRIRRQPEPVLEQTARPAAQPAPQPAEISEPEPERKSDKVGYKNPPKHTQFPKGVSGNPKGRPKGAKGLKTIAREKLTEKVVVKSSAGPKRMTRLDALFLKMIEQAFAGNIRATQFCLQLYQSAVPDEPDRPVAANNNIADVDAHDEAILAALHEALLSRGSDQ